MAYQRALYAVLLAARVLFAVSPAYIHPDEYFQAPEVSASDIFGFDALRTWEFTGEAPVRSIVPIYLFSGTPQIIVRLIQYMLVLAGWQLELTPWLLFYTNRVFMALLSYTIDVCVIRAVRQQYPNARLNATRFVLATSFCLAVFHTHTFANSFASVILAVCFDLLSTIERSARKHKSPKSLNRICLLLGVALALGMFTHVSFPMFALPVALIAGLLLIRSALYSGLLTIAAGGTLTSLALIVADSVYYGSIQLRLADGTLKITGSLTCTVLNNVLYNSNHDNLATHGIHSWYNHMVISVPTLFGPLGMLALAKGWTFIKSTRMRQNTSYVSVAAALSAISGLALLSLVPHQEPRFLVPMLPAIVICTWRWHRTAPAYFWYLWIAFNSVLSVLYGVVHQAGVIPAVVFISQTSVSPSVECRPLFRDDAVCVRVQANRNAATSVRTKVLLFASYMAPRHLLAQPANQGIAPGIHAACSASSKLAIYSTTNFNRLCKLCVDACQARAELHDLISMEDDQVQDLLHNSVYVNCSLARQESSSALVVKETTLNHFERTLLVLPASSDIQRIVPPGVAYSVVPLYSYAPHVNFDHIGEVLQRPLERAQLRVYAVCSH